MRFEVGQEGAGLGEIWQDVPLRARRGGYVLTKRVQEIDDDVRDAPFDVTARPVDSKEGPRSVTVKLSARGPTTQKQIGRTFQRQAAKGQDHETRQKVRGRREED